MSVRRNLNTILKRWGYAVEKRDPRGLPARSRWFEYIQRRMGGLGRPLILDVGANEGQTVLKLKKALPTSVIHAFEPFPGALERLEKLAARYEGVVCHGMALANEPGASSLFVNTESATNSLLPMSEDPALNAVQREAPQTVGKIEIRTETVDRFCADQGIDKVDLLKSDTQGYDLKVLQGAEAMLRSKSIGCVVCESLLTQLYKEQCQFHEILAHLSGRDYGLVGLYDCVYDDQGILRWADALFIPRRS